MAKDSPQAKYSEQNILNNVYDQVLRTLAVALYGWNGTSAQLQTADALATKITTVGSITYIGVAAPGSSQSSAVWQAKKIDSSTANLTLITWADGGGFTQTATDLTALTYT